MKGERVGSMVEATRTFGDTILEIPQFRPSNLSQLIPTNSKYKKIKLPPLVFPSACIRVLLRIKFPASFRFHVGPDREQSRLIVLKKLNLPFHTPMTYDPNTATLRSSKNSV